MEIGNKRPAGRPRIKTGKLMPRLLTWINAEVYEDYRAIYPKANMDQILSKLCNDYMIRGIEKSKNAN